MDIPSILPLLLVFLFLLISTTGKSIVKFSMDILLGLRLLRAALNVSWRDHTITKELQKEREREREREFDRDTLD